MDVHTPANGQVVAPPLKVVVPQWKSVYARVVDPRTGMRCSRRSALRLAGVVSGVAATAGCIGIDTGSDYSLVANGMDGSLAAKYLFRDPVELPAVTRVDYTTETKRAYLDELFDTGSVTVLEWPRPWRRRWGTGTRPRPVFLERDGVFYEVQVAGERQLDRGRWVFACERMDERPPDDATVATDPFSPFSERDRKVIEAALDAVYAGHDGFLGDPEFDELQTVQFHHELSTEDSDLVPTPPFEYIEYEGETFRVVTQERTVTVPEWTYTLERVGGSRERLETYATETVPDTRLDATSLSDAARGVLDAAVDEEDGRPTYEEDAPLSDGLTEVLERLGIAADLRPLDAYDDLTRFKDVVASYESTWYRFSLVIDA